VKVWQALLALGIGLLVACGPVTARDRVELDVPFIAQETLLCVPTSAAMVLAFYGDAQPPRKLKVLASGRRYDPSAPFSDFSITLYDDLVRGVKSLGYDWRQQTYPLTQEGFLAGFDQLKQDLDAGRPALVDISYDGVGHTFVVTGYDARRGEIYFVDPAAPAPGRKTATVEQFEAAWNELAYGGRFRAMLRTQKRS
jgi:hypothetical protein